MCAFPNLDAVYYPCILTLCLSCRYALAVCLVFVWGYREAQPYNHVMHNKAICICQWEILLCGEIEMGSN
jgi:hypothetical protein